MLDESGDTMTEVGYMGDPMRIRASSPGADITNDETYFTPGNGLANFGRMTFNNPGRFSLLIELSYAGEANVTVSSVQTISFEVTEDVPSRIAVGKPAASPSEQLLSLSNIEIVMYDSKVGWQLKMGQSEKLILFHAYAIPWIAIS